MQNRSLTKNEPEGLARSRVKRIEIVKQAKVDYLNDIQEIVQSTDFLVYFNHTSNQSLPKWMSSQKPHAKIEVTLPVDQEDRMAFLTQKPKSNVVKRPLKPVHYTKRTDYSLKPRTAKLQSENSPNKNENSKQSSMLSSAKAYSRAESERNNSEKMEKDSYNQDDFGLKDLEKELKQTDQIVEEISNLIDLCEEQAKNLERSHSELMDQLDDANGENPENNAETSTTGSNNDVEEEAQNNERQNQENNNNNNAEKGENNSTESNSQKEEESANDAKTGEEVLAEVLKNANKSTSSSEDERNVFNTSAKNDSEDDFVVDVQLETKNQKPDAQ